MLKMQNIKNCRKFLDAFILDFYKSVTVIQFKRYSKVNTLVDPVKLSNNYCTNFIVQKQFKTWSALSTEESDAIEGNENESEKKAAIDPSKDRTKVIPPEISIRYMQSEAYKTTYGDEAVWVKYRRNFKGQFVPRETRKTCIRGGVLSTGNPCPICRDEYLVLHHTNVDLLKQFISPETGKIFDPRKTHICQKKLLQLEVAIKKAKFYGYLIHEVPFRKYNYSEYYPNWQG